MFIPIIKNPFVQVNLELDVFVSKFRLRSSASARYCRGRVRMWLSNFRSTFYLHRCGTATVNRKHYAEKQPDLFSERCGTTTLKLSFK
jgi:hypothetical protein